MPRIHLPRVRLGFLKKLLPPWAGHDALPEPATNSGLDTQDEKAAAREATLEECPICHDPVGAKNPEGILESWVHLHCNHKFGNHCIQTWLRESSQRDPRSIPSCPICRTAAKHPCGHPVVFPGRRQSFVWPSVPLTPPGASNTVIIEGRRPRRRLSRRLGHPHRPPTPPPVRAQVQTVGECTICASVALAQGRMKGTTTTTVEADGLSHSRRAQIGVRRTAIKSLLLDLQPGFIRQRSSPGEYSRDQQNYADFLGRFGQGAPPSRRRPTPGQHDPYNPMFADHRDSLTLCRTDAVVGRSLRPVPALTRTLTPRSHFAGA